MASRQGRIGPIVRRFLGSDSGAVTVDWVVLTAAVIGMGMLVLIPVATGTENLSELVGSRVSGVAVGYGSN